MNNSLSQPQAAASSLGDGAIERMAAPAAYVSTPHGQRKCENCTFCHPERPNRPCSVFKELRNQNGDCSAYIETARKEK